MSTRVPPVQQASGFPARLRQRLEHFGSAGALALAIQRSESAVRKWLRGLSEPSVTDLRAVCEITQTRIEWLVSGRGSPEQTPVLRDPSPPYAQAAPPLDLARLEAVIGAVEARLRETHCTLAPLKHATLIAACYDLSREGVADREVVARLVNLAR